MGFWDNPLEGPLERAAKGVGKGLGKAADWYAQPHGGFWGMVDEGEKREEAEQQTKRDAGAAANLPQNRQAGPGGVAIDTSQAAAAERGAKYLALMKAVYGLDEGETMLNVVKDRGDGTAGISVLGEELKVLHEMHGPEIEALQRKLYKGGFYGSDTKASDIRWSQWDQATLGATVGMFKEAARRAQPYMGVGALEGDPPTWQSVLDDAARMGSSQGTGTTTTKSVVLSTEGMARNNLKQAMSDLLGRKPSSQEVRRFHRRLNAAQKASPAITMSGTNDPTADLTGSGGSGGSELSRLGIGDDEIQVDNAEIQDGGFADGDADMLAEEEVLRNNGVEAGAFKIGSLTNAFEQLMLGG